MTARDRIMLIVVAIAALAAAGWFLVLSPMRDDASSLAAQIDTQQQARTAALAEVAAGEQARHDYTHDYATVARLGAAVPEDDNVASLIVQVQHAASVSGVAFSSLRVGGGGSGAAPPAPPSSSPAAATQLTTATLPPGAVVGTAGFPTMPFSFKFTGDFFRLSDFVGRLERFLVVRNRAVSVSGRFMAIDGIGLAAAPSGFPKIEASVAATTYLLPASQGLTDGATSGGPADAGTPASGAGASSGSGAAVAPASATATPVVR